MYYKLTLYHFLFFLKKFVIVAHYLTVLKIIEFLIVHCMNVLEFVIVPGFVMWGTNPGMS